MTAPGAPVRVCFVIAGLGTGGAERSMAEVLRREAGRGIDAEVVCLHHRTEGVEAEVVAQGVPVHVLAATTLRGRRRELRALWGQQGPDLVVSSGYDADLLVRASRLPGRSPTVLTTLINTPYEPARAMEDPNLSKAKLLATQVLDGVSARLASDHFHAVSRATGDIAVRRLHLRPRDVTVIPRGRSRERMGHATPERRAAVRASLGLGEEPVLLVVGRREYQKGHRHLLDALPAIREAHPDVVVLVAGRDGNASRDLDAQAEELGVAATVRLLGHRTDVADLMVAADLLVFPSLWEGFAGVVAEAMAMGLPVVTAAVPGAVEALGDGDPRPGVVVPIGDAPALARAVITLLDDPPRREAMGRAGASRFAEAYEIERVVADTVALYRRVGSAGRRR